jgi:Flp pilus assembly protein TadG
MRRMTLTVRRGDDRGGVAALVAVVLSFGGLIGMAALSVDVGQLYAERRQVQNGADGAALALARDCANPATTCDTSTAGLARTMANANANDSATNVLAVCGKSPAATVSCPASSLGTSLPRCFADPTGSPQGWVRVVTATATAGGGTLLPPIFARALEGNAGYAGTQVGACGQAVWGTEGSGNALPLTLSACEWNTATANGTTFAPSPPYPPYPAGEVALKLHATNDTTGGCTTSGSGSLLPGGFGWLNSTNCQTTSTAGGWVNADPGVSASSCADQLAALVGTLLYLPVFDQATGTGSGGQYHIKGFAAFYLSGYVLPGAHPTTVNPPGTVTKCKGSDKCIYGWFTQGLAPSGGQIGSGPYMGARVVALTD